ncbi:MAG: DNA polymerase II [Akkermansiaceae bacterium]|nr:DNA polymerase II [Akkermansiaceae bacterium]
MKTKEPDSIIDTSKMSAGERAALEMAEASRDTRAVSGFAASLFTGNTDFRRITPFPAQSLEDRDQGDAFLRKLESFLKERTDPDRIDREGEIPDEVIADLGAMGAFGIKIPTKYGGLGLSQTNYSRAAMLLGGHCGNLTALLSAHQSIGVPQPLIVFGTEAQKQKYLPEFAKGAISAFALTEQDVGSDPARMKTEATLSADGTHFILNGEKLWCTNGLKAKYIVVMAKTPTEERPHATTAFVVDAAAEGVEIVTRCHFMGLKALYNGVIRFDNVKVPRENVVHEEGKGLKVALTTLNTGRITLPAACAGMMKELLKITLRWSKEREQWGANIGRHGAIAGKLADLIADQYATESMVYHVSALVDADKKADVRLEAAMAKLWGTEAGWHAVDEAMQIKGGRGYETADSLRARGETPDPIERIMRDSRINTIFEGSSEIMRLFIAREALDPHLRRGAAALDTRKPMGQRLAAAAKAGAFYAFWFPGRFLPLPVHIPGGAHPKLKREMRAIARRSRKLSRRLFQAMARYGPKLDRQQLLLGRFVDVACELYAMAAGVSRAQHLLETDSPDAARALQATRYLCARGRRRIATLFREASKAPDKQGYQLAQSMLE